MKRSIITPAERVAALGPLPAVEHARSSLARLLRHRHRAHTPRTRNGGLRRCLLGVC